MKTLLRECFVFMREEKNFTIGHIDSFEKNGKWSLVRRSLGISSFGINLVTIPPGEQIPEHDEVDRDHEELFICLEGSPTMVIDGVNYSMPKGTYVRLDPPPLRTVKNGGKDPAKVLVISAPVTSGYTPLDWA